MLLCLVFTKIAVVLSHLQERYHCEAQKLNYIIICLAEVKTKDRRYIDMLEREIDLLALFTLLHNYTAARLLKYAA